jgi:hypothetical protein
MHAVSAIESEAVATMKKPNIVIPRPTAEESAFFYSKADSSLRSE